MEYTWNTDQEALDVFQQTAQLEGILPVVETSHAIAHTLKTAGERSEDDVIVICLSGRGDKDVNWAALLLGREI